MASSSGLPAHEHSQFLREHLLLATYLSLLPDTANYKKGRTSTACGCSDVFQEAGAEDVMGVGAKPELGVCHCVHLILLVWQLRYELRAFQ